MSTAVAIALLIAYTVPASIAIHRNMTDRITLAVTNLLFGWTVLGWFTCLMWAALGRAESSLRHRASRPPAASPDCGQGGTQRDHYPQY